MRILIATKPLFKAGGMQRGVIGLANNMVKRGHEVTLVGKSDDDASLYYPVDDRVEVVNIESFYKTLRFRLLPLFSNIVRIFNEKFYNKHLRSLAEHDQSLVCWKSFCIKRNPDLVIATLPGTFTALTHGLKNTGIPVVINNRNNPHKDYSPERVSNHPEDVRLRNLAPEIAAANIVQLPEYKDFFSAAVQKKTYIIPNCIIQIPIEGWAHPERDDKQKIIISTGRLSDIKDHQTLIKAFAMLHSDFPEWQVKIFGEGELEEKLNGIIMKLGLEKKVFLLGHTDKVFDEIRVSHLFAFPSYFEGCPNSLAEAMAHGLPTIGFDDASGVNSLIQHEKSGFLADGKNRIESFAFYLRKLMADAELRKNMGISGIEYVKGFKSDYVYDLWENILKEILASYNDDSPGRK